MKYISYLFKPVTVPDLIHFIIINKVKFIHLIL